MRNAVTPISAPGGITDSTTRTKLFDWVSNVLDENGLGRAGGIIRLLCEGDETPTVEVRDWPVQAVAENDLSGVAGVIADQIIQEAEACCEGSGGGEMQFFARAYKSGERSAYRNRPFTIALEESRAKKQRTANHKDVLSALSQQNLELHKVVLSYSGQMPKIVDSLRKTIEDSRKLDAENFALLKANIENRDGREAEAYAVFQHAEMFNNFGKTLITVGVPALVQYAVPHLMPILVDWMSKPENAKMAQGLINMIASSFAQPQQQQPQQPQIPSQGT